MSFVDIERLFDRFGAGAGGSGASPHEFIAREILYPTREEEFVTETGEKVKRKVIDVDARTEINAPVAFAASQIYFGGYLARRFKMPRPVWLTDADQLSLGYTQMVKVLMISKERRGRTEFERIMEAYFSGQKYVDQSNLPKEILSK